MDDDGSKSTLADKLKKTFGIKGEANSAEEEIIEIVNEGHEKGLIQTSEAQMISNILEFNEKEVRDIMINRPDIVAIDEDTSLQDALRFMIDGHNSRYPVYEENIDHIKGILYLKDAVRFHLDDTNSGLKLSETKELMRDAYFVPEKKNIDELFREMQKKKLQMAIVVDEYGQTEGLVTMEDILEEIVGNIQDEYDAEDEHIEEKSKDEYVIDGKTTLEELTERFGIDFDTEDFETINGYLISRLDKIPEDDESFEVSVGDYNFRILEVSNKMITSVLVTKSKLA